jgi:hypothetical protein
MFSSADEEEHASRQVAAVASYPRKGRFLNSDGTDRSLSINANAEDSGTERGDSYRLIK